MCVVFLCWLVFYSLVLSCLALHFVLHFTFCEHMVFFVVLGCSQTTRGLISFQKTHNWSATEKQEEEEEKKEVITGLSVLAWPSKYFHNYAALLKEIGIDDCQVRLPFALRDPDFTDFFHGEFVFCLDCCCCCFCCCCFCCVFFVHVVVFVLFFPIFSLIFLSLISLKESQKSISNQI